MARCVLSVALLFAQPIAPHPTVAWGPGETATSTAVPRPISLEEALKWPSPPVSSATTKAETFDSSSPPTESPPSLSVESPPVASSDSSLPSPLPPIAQPQIERSPIEAGMARLADLGATDWQLRTFGCLGFYESTNNPYAVSATGDYGWLQINKRYHGWRWAGRDIFDPAVNAEVAWDIYRESGFRAWTTHGLCGV